MASAKPLRHMVVVLPGIMGSVLKHRDGPDIWALSGQALLQFLKTNGKSLTKLQIAQDDPDALDLGDGIYADRLISDIYNIPGLMDGAGYSVLVKQTLKALGGRLIEGSIHTPHDDANFFAFPYDWRRDNRSSALKLKQFVETQLPRWRAKSGASDAKVIFLAHSMGGLVARYYVEKLGGWQYTRRVITFGTPHRGSLNALNVLSNGFRISAGGVKGLLVGAINWKYPDLFNDLTALVRSFPAAYQLLPTYGVFKEGDTYRRIYEVDGIPNINKARAASAFYDFHQPIIDANEANRQTKGYSNPTKPVVGVGQPTYQSAFLTNGVLELSIAPPQDLEEDRADGDGTVPRVSAVPLELTLDDDEIYLPEHHGWLTNVTSYLNVLPEYLKEWSTKGSALLNDEKTSVPITRELSLDVEPLYLNGEPVTVDIKITDGKGGLRNLQLFVVPVDAAAEPRVLPVKFSGRKPAAQITIPPPDGKSSLPAGLYRLRLAGTGAEINSTFEITE